MNVRDLMAELSALSPKKEVFISCRDYGDHIEVVEDEEVVTIYYNLDKQ